MLARAQALEAAGPEIIHLEIGQPDVPTFEHIARAGMQAIANGIPLHPLRRMKDLRRSLPKHGGRQRGIAFRPEKVVVGPGAKPFCSSPPWALVRPGDEVIYPTPGFLPMPPMIAVAAEVPIPVAAE